ncbi:MAG TPA: mannose-1-phosphate guanyltransferase [Rhodobacteraceae bacterium]|mgnify:CR=1 FL=1|jgi:ABC-2 type transport system permease protein|nr:ABC transporter permease [Paracoccaceae bacterium]HBG97784.1 mannose-1-phosphate guanyltransferase [Paracoccaceae bacterium]
MSARFSLRRLGALFAKEVIQMRRDRVTFAMMLFVPLMQLILFGYAINTDPKRLSAALVAPSPDRYARAIVSALEVTDYYRFRDAPLTAAEAETLMRRGHVSFIVTIPSDFGRRLARGDKPQILVEADATDPAAASGAVSTLARVAAEAIAHVNDAENRADARGAVEVVVHRRYNPEAITQYNVVPGLLGVILQLTIVMMTAIALTREIERGTMENLLAMPATPLEIMLGKVLPYFGVGAVQVVVILGAAKGLFGVPFLGSLWLLLAGVMAFVFAMALLGYTISTFARTQMQAMQLTFFFFLPSILLSGFMFPFQGMPGWARAIGEALPLTHFLRLVRGVMLKGSTLPDVANPFAALLLFVVLFAAVALLRFRRTLD